MRFFLLNQFIITVLNSDIAVEVSIKIIDTFVEMRKFIKTYDGMFGSLDIIEKLNSSF